MGRGGDECSFDNIVDRMKHEKFYENYLLVRDWVLSTLSQTTSHNDISEYWKQELSGFEYMFDASPLIIMKLREHCHHITGIRSYDYRQHHKQNIEKFKNKLNALKELDNIGLFVDEPHDLGGFGFEIDGKLVNIDTLKFYESIIALEMGNVFKEISSDGGKRPIVLEIGSGWGGFAYQFKTINQNCTYILIDLPQTMIFSGVYLTTMFPDKKFLFYSNNDGNLSKTNISDYDFIFIPCSELGNINFEKIDLAVNMVSFQEMTTEQIEFYIKWLYVNNCKYLYSHNRGCSHYNTELYDVGEILNQGFTMERISVLPIPYTELKLPEKQSVLKYYVKCIHHLITSKIYAVSSGGTAISNRKNSTNYTHLLGVRRTELNNQF